MSRAILIVIAFVSALSVPLENSGRAQEQGMTNTPPSVEGSTTITIATAGSFLGLRKDRYNVGDQILVSIKMTNSSAEPLNVCVSSDLYQNVPTLTRNGEVVPIMQWQKYEQVRAERNETCKEVNLPETVILNPKEPKMVDWFVLVDSSVGTGAEAWYDSLPPGKYELSIQRRLDCCEGPMLTSNKVNFEVVP